MRVNPIVCGFDLLGNFFMSASSIKNIHLVHAQPGSIEEHPPPSGSPLQALALEGADGRNRTRTYPEAVNPGASDELAAALASNARLMQENAYLRIEMQQQVSLRTILQRELISLQARYPECAAEFSRLVRCIEQHEQLRLQRLPGASLQADLCSESESEASLLPSSGALIVQLNEALKRTLDMQDKNEQALAIRMGRLLALAQKAGLEQEFKRIVAGSPVPGEPPGYNQLVHTLRFRAERAERDIAHYVDKAENLERRMEQLAEGFMDVVSGLEAENARLRTAFGEGATGGAA